MFDKLTDRNEDESKLDLSSDKIDVADRFKLEFELKDDADKFLLRFRNCFFCNKLCSVID